MTTAHSDLKFAIVGGGIAGLTLAIALHHRGLNVKIYEQANQFHEIGAGVSFTPNAIQAMKICHPEIHEAFERVCTRNIWPSKRKVWFDYYDTQRGDATGKPAFSICNSLGQNAVHRAQFLDELIKLIPHSIASYGKRLDRFEEKRNGKMKLIFTDNTVEEADVILACDGIKSRSRQVLFGVDNPCSFPTYTHKYAYRALVPMEDAISAMGEEMAQNSGMHMGEGGHVLTFPVRHGEILNIVAFHTSTEPWPNAEKLTAEATREDLLRDFAHFSPEIINLLRLTKPKLDVWAIFDLGDNPLPTFTKGRVCLVGDAAHATSPHHGAGAGLCIEDAAVLAHLLSDRRASDHAGLEKALEVYDSVRRERGSWLVQSSRHIGNTYELLAPGIEDDLSMIEAEINYRNGVIANVNVQEMCDDARRELRERDDETRDQTVGAVGLPKWVA